MQYFTSGKAIASPTPFAEQDSRCVPSAAHPAVTQWLCGKPLCNLFSRAFLATFQDLNVDMSLALKQSPSSRLPKSGTYVQVQHFSATQTHYCRGCPSEGKVLPMRNTHWQYWISRDCNSKATIIPVFQAMHYPCCRLQRQFKASFSDGRNTIELACASCGGRPVGERALRRQVPQTRF